MSDYSMIHLPFDPVAFQVWRGERGYHNDEGQALHHLLSETFGKGVLQPFRVMKATGAKTSSLYAYSTKTIDDLRATAAETGMPNALAVCAPERIQMKGMPSAWKEGKRYAFDVRLRPVRRLAKDIGGYKKGAEVDAYQVACLNARYSAVCEPIGTREDVYLEWLQERLMGAATVDTGTMKRFQMHKASRKGRSINGPDITFHGELTVTDPVAFAELLRGGVGRHKAYGFGMMLLRPVKD
ncbi:type I-E CRISPR-associated protein Cas6/Cse3/CasE [Thalassospira xianhensis]|uniref:CRISPR-associated protein Cse3 n=1 Tax=Thalassospira xianhensis MCCC 1A02616 TaxID=1177929 RepID=A0A367UG83_9PROT|nr:type I-E CRISPR-associated protein Cas6/Cse3/CasE [Thalassospira xianhensis]RCK06324.1 hypothetical protein TH5_08975 [Thalassospira xianhensis MCCC 1A02616]